MDYFLKSSEVFKLRKFVNLSQSPVFQIPDDYIY